MYGLLNIALNYQYLYLIWDDLKKIYKLVSQNTEIVDFMTKVDLFSACAKFIAEKIMREPHSP
jgi:hypothetical protein